MPINPLTPLPSSQRVAIIDMLRGWALLGVVLMNYGDFVNIGSNEAPKLVGFSKFLFGYFNFLFAGKSWTLLSFLFGYGFAVLMDNTAAKGMHSGWFFTRRMFWLMVLAVINSAFFFGDILKDYAWLGMFLLLFHRFSAKVVFYCSIGLFLIMPLVGAYISRTIPDNMGGLFTPYLYLYKSHSLPDVLWFGLIGTYKLEITNPRYQSVHIIMLACFLLGLAAQKINFFTRLSENKKIVKQIFWYSLAFSVMMFTINLLLGEAGVKQLYRHFSMRFWVVIGNMLLISSSLCWLYLSGKLKRFFTSMQFIGRMTLTNYIVQNMLGLVLFSGFGFGFGTTNTLPAVYYYLFALSIYIAQVYFSKWWLARYYFGPVEWVWRQLSYGKWLPIKRAPVGGAGKGVLHAGISVD